MTRYHLWTNVQHSKLVEGAGESKGDHSVDDIRPVFDKAPEHPNGPEVSGTSFPLLSTVLAGFAVTIAVQLMLLPDGDGMSSRTMVALGAALLAMLLFISSIGFALNAQAHNYLPFLDLGTTGQRLLHVDDPSVWLRRIAGRWAVFYTASLASFFSAVALLLVGINVIVWEFVGSGMALLLLIAILINLFVAVLVLVGADRMAPAYPDLEREETP